MSDTLVIGRIVHFRWISEDRCNPAMVTRFVRSGPTTHDVEVDVFGNDRFRGKSMEARQAAPGLTDTYTWHWPKDCKEAK